MITTLNPVTYQFVEAFLRETPLNTDRLTVEKHAKKLAAQIQDQLEQYVTDVRDEMDTQERED